MGDTRKPETLRDWLIFVPLWILAAICLLIIKGCESISYFVRGMWQ